MGIVAPPFKWVSFLLMTGCLKYCSTSVGVEMVGVRLEVDSAASMSKASQTGFGVIESSLVKVLMVCVCCPRGSTTGVVSVVASFTICLVVLSTAPLLEIEFS